MNEVIETLVTFLIVVLAGAGFFYLVCTMIPELLLYISSTRLGRAIVIVTLIAFIIVVFWAVMNDSSISLGMFSIAATPA